MLPTHLAIIMDGNGRWARARGEDRLVGHQRGVQTLRDVMTACAERGIKYLTVYAFSTENWGRPAEEVGGLMQLLEHYLKTEIENLRRDQIGLRCIGDRTKLPENIRELLRGAMAELAANEKHILTLALNYGGRDEIVRAARTLAAHAANGGLIPEQIDEKMFAAHLDTGEIPDPDLFIRTAGEQRLSNFLLWQASYAELYFTEKCWPDFDRAELDRALTVYQNRRRQFGLVGTASPAVGE